MHKSTARPFRKQIPKQMQEQKQYIAMEILTMIFCLYFV